MNYYSNETKTPLLSVIIPVYNVEKYLDTCIQSVLQQTLNDIEVILVDDESPDGCPIKCDEYAQNDDRVKVIHKKNEGLGYARNSGLDIALGKYVTFIDSDDYIESDAYKTLCDIAEMHNCDKVRFSFNRFEHEGAFSETKSGMPVKLYENPEELKNLSLYLFAVSIKNEYVIGGSSCMAIYRRDIIEQNGLRFESEREYISEDYLFNFLYYKYAKRVGYLPNTYYHYRVNPKSLTQTARLDRIEKVEIYSKYIGEVMQKVGYTEDDMLFSLDYYIGTFRSAVKSIFMSTMTMSSKKKWFKVQVSSPYFRKVCNIYPFKRINKKQQMCLFLMKHKLFYLSYIFITGFTVLRNK